jgi:peroxiredoxin
VLKVGDWVPGFRAKTTEGRDLTSEELKGKFAVIYFFPKAFTPGCTRQTARFRDAYPDLKELGAEVIGVSVDDHETQCEFADKMQVAFPMVGDGNHEISRAFGVLRKWLKLDRRVTFVVDPQGVVRGVFEHEFQISRHLDDVLHLLEKLVKARAEQQNA